MVAEHSLALTNITIDLQFNHRSAIQDSHRADTVVDFLIESVVLGVEFDYNGKRFQFRSHCQMMYKISDFNPKMLTQFVNKFKFAWYLPRELIVID